MLNKKIFLLFTSALILSCSVTESTVKPSASTKPITGVSSSPTLMPSVTPSTLLSAQPTAIPSVFVPAENGILVLKDSYLKTPASAFLSEKTFDIQFKVSLASLPAKDQVFSFFDMYDESDKSKLKSHYALNLDSKGVFSLNTNAKDYNNVFNFNFNMEVDKDYVFSFKKTNDTIEITIDGVSVFSNSFKYTDFDDLTGKRTINFGADMNGKNKTPFKMNYIKIPEVLTYLFKKDFSDSYKYALNGIIKEGTYEFIYKDKFDVTPTPLATATPSPTPIPSLEPVKERQVSNTSGTKIRLDLNVYDPNNSTQYSNCMDKKTEDENTIRRTTNNSDYKSTKNCSDPNGVFYSKWYDFGSKSTSSTSSDLRIITDVYQDFSEILFSGSDTSGRIQILDIGVKNYEGVDLNYLINKVDYTNKNKFYSDSVFSTKALPDHVYAIKTYQYGKEPRYAKVVVNDIITNDYAPTKLQPPQLDSAPQLQSLVTGTSSLSNTATYDYYVSTYDGAGETSPRYLGQILPSGLANTSKSIMSFIVPYGAKGFTIYKQVNDNSTTKVYKIGPYISKVAQSVSFEDIGSKGALIDSIPVSDSTTKYVFKPTLTSKPIAVEFSYTFFGAGTQ